MHILVDKLHKSQQEIFLHILIIEKSTTKENRNYKIVLATTGQGKYDLNWYYLDKCPLKKAIIIFFFN